MYFGETLNCSLLGANFGGFSRGGGVKYYCCPSLKPSFGFYLNQTEVSLSSRHSRDEEVSGQTLASLGISFTEFKEVRAL